MNYRLIQAMREGTPPDMDVYDAAAWSAPGPLSFICVAHDIANGLKVARATELTSVTPLAAQGGGAARDFENTLKTRETYLKTYLKHIISSWKSMILSFPLN